MSEVIITTNLVQTVNIELTAITGGVLPDGIVENTDETYSDTVANGSTLVIPDINITKNDDSVVQSPAAIDIDLRIIDPATAPSGWDEQVAEYGRGYTFGQEGASIIYRTGDDASIESTVLGILRAADALKMHNQIDPDDFTKVKNTNSFGNLSLWTDDAGGQTYSNDYIINHITGLGYIGTSKTGAGSWNASIDAALANTTDAGHTNWFMASLNQTFSIIDKDVINPRMLFAGQPSMFSIGAGAFIVSTTGLTTTDETYYFNAFNTPLSKIAKSGSNIYLLCRPHF